MYRVVRVVHLHRAPDDAFLRRVRVAASLVDPHPLVEPTHPASINGGDVLIRVTTPDADTWLRKSTDLVAVLDDSCVRHIDGAEYGDDGIGTFGERSDAGSTVYRTLLLRVDPHVDAQTVARFERGTLRMPDHVTSMASWRLSRVVAAQGNSWTHVWEQTYRTLDGLLGQYMLHPIHWGYVDKWFDPECPDHIVTDRVCHSLCVMSAER